ncbi:MAG: addiction module protein [Lacipirellulaceae bacterium]
MNASIEDLTFAALSLPVADREALVAALVESLPTPGGVLDEASPGFFEELDRRFDEYASGQTTAEEWSVVRSRLESLVRGRPSDDQV